MSNADRLIEIYSEANARPAGAERDRYVAESCGAEIELRDQVIRLLQSHQNAGDFLKEPIFPSVVLVAEKPGDAIGRYTLLEKIGEGGCGVVYVAEQNVPVRRRVALKVLKLGLDTTSVIARFEGERQALAMMDHPNIAKVLDAGATDTGRPYFVMELVRGVAITNYCDENSLSTRERLDLFIKVCGAIQHAHQKGIIHRDIKPSNILVTLHDGVPVPRVIDFGIAKAIEGRLSDATVYTQLLQFVGTPAYMSPEQAELSGLDIDTRSDIYSLGVLLYELLTGKTPFDAQRLMASGLDAMRKTIRETEPVRPSTRLTQEFAEVDLAPREPRIGLAIRSEAEATAEMRAKVRLKEQINRVRGDLDWIVMKCLEKDRTRRYETANGLAADLNRHLDNEPVIARPPSAAYKVQKAWRRNRLAFSSAASIAVALLAGIGVSTWQAFEASRARDGALAEKIIAQRDSYIANMNLAGQAWEERNYEMVRQLLEDTRSFPDRGFEWYYWQRQTHLNLAAFYGHVGSVITTAFFPEGQRIVTGSHDKSARVWDAGTGRELFALLGHRSSVNAVAVSPDGKQVATGSGDQLVIIWDASNGHEMLRLEHSKAVTAVAFSPDGGRIVTGSTDAIARIWRLATREVIVILEGHSKKISSVAFSPDGEKVLTGSHDRTARVWNSSDGTQPPLLLDNHAKEIFAVAFFPNGKTILTGSFDHLVRFWDARTGNEVALPLVANDPVIGLGISEDGRRIATGSWSGVARVWNASNGWREHLIRGHLRGVSSVAISPNGNLVATGGGDDVVKVWDVEGDPDQLRGEGATNAVLGIAISPDGERVAIGRGIPGNDGVITGSGDQGLQVWDLNTKEKLLTISDHGSGVSSVVYSPDGSRILSGSGDHTAKLWDAASGRLLHTLNGHAASVTSVAFFPNGKQIVTGSRDRTAIVWNSVTGAKLFALPGHIETVSSVAVSPDGQLIATGSFDRTARIWDASSGRLVRKIELPTAQIYSLAFSPDSRRIALAGWGPPTVWYLEQTNRVPLILLGHSFPVASIGFSADGRRIITGSLDATAKVWEAVTGREVLTLRGHSNYLNSVAMSLDGQRIVTGSADQTARIWTMATTNQVVDWGEGERAGAKMQAASRQQLAASDEKYALTEKLKRVALGRQDPGAIKRWLVLAPIPLSYSQSEGEYLDSEQIKGESRLEPKAGESLAIGNSHCIWQELASDDYLIDFNAICGQETAHSAGYAACYIWSARERHGLQIRVGSNDGSKIYLNGKQVYRCETSRIFNSDQDRVENVSLNAGKNVLIFKVVNVSTEWCGSIRFTDAQGNPLSSIRVSLDSTAK